MNSSPERMCHQQPNLPAEVLEEIDDSYITIKKKLSDSRFPTYIVHSSKDDKYYAMKTFKYTKTGINPSYTNEARFAGLFHPNIVPIVGIQPKREMNESDKIYNVSYILMELAFYDFSDYANLIDLSQDEILVRTFFHQLEIGRAHV